MLIDYCILILLINSYCILILLIISYCILVHPGICILWCRTTMRPARLVSYAFLYTTNRSQNYPAKIQKKSFSQTRKIQEKSFMGKDTGKVCRKQLKGSKRSTTVGKTVKHTID